MVQRTHIFSGYVIGALIFLAVACGAPEVGAQLAVVTSVTATPSTALARSPVTIRVNGSGTVGVGCALTVLFDDGGSRIFGTGTTLPLSIVHSYTRAGDFEPNATVSGGLCPFSTGSTAVRVRTETTAPFSLRRVELRFDNGRGEITVPKDYRGLKVYADILFNGSGLLTAAWEVDGRTLVVINENLAFGSRKIFSNPDIPPFPTFEPGLHTIRFRVISPAPSFTIPTVNYYVEGRPAGPANIELVSPDVGAPLVGRPANFRWKGVPGVVSYRVEIFTEGKKEPVFIALTRETSYVMPELYHKRFTTGSKYTWRALGLDKQGAEVAESEMRTFIWQP